jgi:hypothetical protein
MIGMNWLESHDVVLNYKKKWLSLVNDEGQRCVIVGRNQGVSLRFISSLKLQKRKGKGCNLYVILALNKNGVVEGLEHLPVVREFADFFSEQLPVITLNCTTHAYLASGQLISFLCQKHC